MEDQAREHIEESHGPGAATAATADVTKRVVAGVIDGVLAVVVGFIPLLGGVIATVYWLVRDGLTLEFMDGRSVGKKIMKLRPVRADGAPMDLGTSVRRNFPFALVGIAQILVYIPILGWLLLIPVLLLTLLVGIVEAVLVVTDGEGRRMGDRFAGTRVVEAAA